MTLNDFGWSSSVDTDSLAQTADRIRFIFDYPTSDGTLDSFWARASGNWDSAGKARGALYVSSTRALVAQTGEMHGKSTVPYCWISSNFGPSSITTDTDYIIVIWGDADTSKNMARDTNGAYYWHSANRDYSASSANGISGNFSAYLDPFDANSSYNHTTGFSMEMFISYTVAGAATTVSQPLPGLSRIYYSCNNYPNSYVDAPISRWDRGNHNIIIETFLGSSARDDIFANVTPGAVRELYNILGTPKFIDTTYSSSNTLIIEPQAGYGLSSLRERRIIAVKNIQDDFLTSDFFHIKIEGIDLE